MKTFQQFKEALQTVAPTAPAPHAAVIARPRCANCGGPHATADHAKETPAPRKKVQPASKGSYLTHSVYEKETIDIKTS
jgi:hypothetical protein